MGKYKSFVPIFCVLLHAPPIMICHILLFLFLFLFLLWLISYDWWIVIKVVHKKWDREFVFMVEPCVSWHVNLEILCEIIVTFCFVHSITLFFFIG